MGEEEKKEVRFEKREGERKKKEWKTEKKENKRKREQKLHSAGLAAGWEPVGRQAGVLFYYCQLVQL
jgi:hypothetical protein